MNDFVTSVLTAVSTDASNWVTATATAVSAIVLILTLVVAYAQLRGLNKASQLQNFIELTQETDGPAFSAAYAFVMDMEHLSKAAKIDKANADAQGTNPQIDIVANFFERIGFLVKHRYLDNTLGVTWWGVMAKDAYDVLAPVLDARRIIDPGAATEWRDFVKLSQAHWEKSGRRKPR